MTDRSTMMEEDFDDDDIEEMFEEEEGEPHPPTQSSRPSWFFTISLSSISLICGVVAGAVGDGSVAALNDFQQERSVSRYQMPEKQAFLEGQAAPLRENTPPAWFPDNNHVEWSTSLRPNEQPAAIDVRNESRNENRKILFQMADGRIYRLAATLYVKAGQQAVVRLPVGSYRVDVASSSAQMPWADAQRLTPMPRYAIKLSAPDDQQTPMTRIFINEDGKIRESAKPEVPVSEPKPRKTTDKKSETDYGLLTKKSLAAEESSEISETSSDE